MVSPTLSHQQLAEHQTLREATLSGRTLSITIIRAGFNTSATRYYTDEALRSGVAVFDGLKMYLNHQTMDEERERPEGDLRDWVASLTDVRYDESQRAIVGVAKLADPQFVEKVALLDEQGLLGTLGVSIRALGSGEEDEIEGVSTFRVDEFVAGRSVDFVTEPGAGGFVMSREAKQQEDDMSAEQIADAEKRAAEANQRAEESERKATEAEERAKKAEEAAAAAQSALEEMKTMESRRESQATIGKLISESSLPQPSKDYLAKALADETDPDKAKAVIESQAELVKQLSEAKGVTGMGETQPGDKPDLGASFKRLGLSDDEAKVAAGVR